MEQNQTEATILIKPTTEYTVTVDGAVTTQYGSKMAIGGDTYDVLAKGGLDAASAMDFNEHHCSWTPEVDSWTMDYGQEHVEALREAVESVGASFGGAGAEAARELVSYAEDLGREEARTRWVNRDIHIVVTYETKGSGKEMTKEGMVSSVDSTEGMVAFKRDDYKVNRISGNGIYSQSSSYPYMGRVTKVELRF